MSTQTPGTRDRILQAAYSLFYRDGFSRVSVDAIAERAQVTKRTVYYHFKSKDDIAEAALEDLHQRLMPQYEKWVGAKATHPSQMIENLFAALKAWADHEPWHGSGFSRIAAELADLPGHPARRAARSHKGAVEQWLSQRLELAGSKHSAELARQIMTLLEGSIGLALIHGDKRYIQSAGFAAAQLVALANR